MVDTQVSPQFELRNSSSTIATMAEPRYMTVQHFCKAYGAAVSEIEIVGLNGQQFVDLETRKAKLLILRARYS
jgi:hypothetical protein